MYICMHVSVVLVELDGGQGEQGDQADHREDLAVAHDLELLARRDLHRLEVLEPRHQGLGLGRENRETCFCFGLFVCVCMRVCLYV